METDPVSGPDCQLTGNLDLATALPDIFNPLDDLDLGDLMATFENSDWVKENWLEGVTQQAILSDPTPLPPDTDLSTTPTVNVVGNIEPSSCANSIVGGVPLVPESQCNGNYNCDDRKHIKMGLFAHGRFKKYENAILVSMLHISTLTVSDADGLARFTCLLCSEASNYNALDMKRHMRNEHGHLLGRPVATSGVVRGLRNQLGHRQNLTNHPVKRYCDICLIVLNSPLESYIHYAAQHISADESIEICTECLYPYFDQFPSRHFAMKHNRFCPVQDCTKIIPSIKFYIDHLYHEHFEDNFPQLNNLESFYNLTKTASGKISWTPHVKAMLFSDPHITNHLIPKIHSTRFYNQVELLGDCKKFLYCNIGIEEVKSSWEGLPLQKAVHRDFKVISALVEYLENAWNNPKISFCIYSQEINQQSSISCKYCLSPNDHSTTTEWCTKEIKSYQTVPHDIRIAKEILTNTDFSKTAFIWIADATNVLRRGPLKSNFEYLNLSYKAAWPCPPILYKNGKPLGMAGGKANSQFFNLATYINDLCMRLPKGFPGAVFIEYVDDGVWDNLEKVVDRVIAFVAFVAELRNRYRHHLVIIGPCPRRYEGQSQAEFENKRKCCHRITNLLTLVASSTYIPCLPIIGTIFGLEKSSNAYVYNSDSNTQELDLLHYSGTASRELIHRLSNLVDHYLSCLSFGIRKSDYLREYESLRRSPNRHKYFNLLEHV